MPHDGILVLDQKKSPKIVVRKMENLRILGSAQFSEEDLHAQSNLVLYIIDLRRESHGYINGLPVSWYFPYNRSNVGLSSDLILAQEAYQIASLKTKNSLIVHMITKKDNGKIIETTPITIVPYLVETEKQLCQRLGLHYFRLPVSDHSRPKDEEVEQFVKFVKDQPKGSWLYFHCRGGRGRTTTFMMLYDMLVNAKSDSLDKIISRHLALGSADLFKVTKDRKALWKKDLQLERKHFLESFYEYAASLEGYPQKTWYQWLRGRN